MGRSRTNPLANDQSRTRTRNPGCESDALTTRPCCLLIDAFALFFKGLELVLSQDTIQVDDHVTVVCEEDLEGSAMVTTVEELFSPSFPADSTVSKTYKWLLQNLQSLPHFEIVRATCCFFLRQVSLLYGQFIIATVFGCP